MSYKLIQGYEVEEFEEYLIYYNKSLGILNIQKSGIDFTTLLDFLFINSPYTDYMHHIYDNNHFMEDLKKIVFEVFDLAKKIQNKNGLLYCHLSTYAFQSLTIYTQFLRNFHLYQNAIKFFRYLLIMVNEWEKNNDDFKIHKGALYGYLGELYMHTLDYETAFTFLHRAVKEDRNIKCFINSYPEDAPSYKIINLKPDSGHFMSGYVNHVREILSKDIDNFSEIFKNYNKFSLKDFDKVFIDNKFFNKEKLEDIKIFILYFIWARYYYRKNVGEFIIPSTFDNLNRLNKLFGLCVAIESIEKELKVTDKLRNDLQQKDLYVFLGGEANKFDELYDKVKRKDEFINELLPELLKYKNNKFDGITLMPIDRCIMIYIIIRNFSAHNVKSINTIGEKFPEIFQSLIFLVFSFLIELKRTGKTE
jgi:hypothetical protein